MLGTALVTALVTADDALDEEPTVVAEPVAVALPLVTVLLLPPLDVVDVGAADELEDDEDVIFLHDISKSGVVLNGFPTMPKLGFGVEGDASWSVYHQTLVLPNRGQPTWSQYVFALSRLGIARLTVLPLTGKPVSVTQTGLPPTAAWVWPIAESNKALPSVMELAIVFWKYG